MSAVTNLLEPEAAIIARLEAALDGHNPSIPVYSVPDLPSIQESQDLAPAIFVVYYTAIVAGTQAEGAWTRYRLTWMVVPVVRNRYDPQSGADSRAEAGAMMATCAAALQGYKPAKGWSGLEADAPAPGFFDVGFAYYPLAFSTTVELKGDPSQ